MADTVELVGGAKVCCRDGECGTLSRLIIDPASRRVTHLVVEPHALLGLNRLAPIDLLSTAGEYLELSLGRAEFDALEAAEERETVVDPSTNQPSIILHHLEVDTVPPGEVEVSGETAVSATDGRVGPLLGVTIDPASHRLVALELRIGHLAHHRATVPIALVAGFTPEGIALALSKNELAQLR